MSRLTATTTHKAEWAPVLAALDEIRARMEAPVAALDPGHPRPHASNVPDLLARVSARFGGTAQPNHALVTDTPIPARHAAEPLFVMPLAPIEPAPAPLAERLPVADAAAPGPVDHAVERQLDLAREGEWLDSLARDIARGGGADGPLKFRLHPEYLGTLEVEVRQAPDGASIRMTAETAEARAIIAEAQPKLVAEARAQGVRIAEAHVDLGQQQAGGHHSADPRGRQPDAQPRGQRAAPEPSTPEPARARSADLYA